MFMIYIPPKWWLCSFPRRDSTRPDKETVCATTAVVVIAFNGRVQNAITDNRVRTAAKTAFVSCSHTLSSPHRRSRRHPRYPLNVFDDGLNG
jgi:hypothetical protein